MKVIPSRGDKLAGDQSLNVSSDATILLDDGQGRRLSVKQSKLEDLPIGAAALVKLSIDQSAAMLIRAEGPTLTGLLKAVDAVNGSITINMPKGRGEAPEEKVLPVAKNARIAIDGNPAQLNGLTVDNNGPMVQVQLSLDQRTAQSIVASHGRDR